MPAPVLSAPLRVGLIGAGWVTQHHLKGCAALGDAGNLRGIHETNDLFHLTLFSGCGNPYLVRTLQDYMGYTLPMRAKNLADHAGLQLSHRQHDIMIELLQGTDRWAPAQLCVDHMQYSNADYLARTAGGAPSGRLALAD